MMNTFIGICGPIGSGKTYTATKLIELFNQNGIPAQKVSFAGTLKAVTERMFHLGLRGRYELLYDTFRPYGSESRSILAAIVGTVYFSVSFAHVKMNEKAKLRPWYQFLGTELGRWVNPNLWILHLQDSIYMKPAVYIADDVRFFNEARFCNILVRLNTEDSEDYQTYVESLPEGYVRHHASEEEFHFFHPDIEVIAHSNDVSSLFDTIKRMKDNTW